MSNARKLQTEIDRVLKKVDEGSDFFDEIWAKVQSADTQNLKEKHEMDLKKEIKKLQRLRDQIKTWVASTEVKDKDALVEARRLIETKMETFKVCEKETKTKTYSKEGLAREDKMDPEEEARLRTTSWLAEYVERFQQQVEEKDFDIEKLSAGKGKKQNKTQIEQAQKHIFNHKYHITKLEGIIRLINNEVLEPDPVDSLQEDIDYYLESYQEDEYIQVYDQDFFYESLGLDELELVNVDRLSQPVVPANKKNGGDDATETSSKESKELKNGKKAAASVIPMTIGRARSKAEKKADQEREENEALALAVAAAAAAAVNTTTATTIATTPSKVSVSSPHPPPAPIPTVASPPILQTGASMAAILKRESEQQQEKERQKQLQLQQEQLRQQQLQQQEQVRLQQQQQQQQLAAQEALQRQQQQEALRQKQQVQQQQQAAVAQQEAAAVAAQQQVVAAQKLQQQQQQQQQQRAAEQKAQIQQQQQQQVKNGQQQQTSALDILTAGLGGLGLGGSTDNRTKENTNLSLGGSALSVGGGSVNTNTSGGNNNNISEMAAGASYLSALNESFVASPSPGDSERSRQYTPQNPYPTPISYPATPSPIFDTSAVFEKLGTDCLFFIFYYAQGTYQQYLAARELKKQSWRFHKKYMTWFQRHEEPKITTDEYEQGTYVYFDYETGWCTRIKQDFRFEYSFLEDSLQ